jgi:hypothetical protein
MPITPAISFPTVAPRSLGAMVRRVERLGALLSGLLDGTIPGPTYSAEALARFCASAIRNQRDAIAHLPPGLWAVTTDVDGMPGDARDHFIRRPTVLVTAILARVRMRPALAARPLPGLDAALRRGLSALAKLGVHGHGHDAAEVAAESRDLLRRAGAVGLLTAEPDLAPELLAELRGSAPVDGGAATALPPYRVVLRLAASETVREYATDQEALAAFADQRKVLWREVCRDFEEREVPGTASVALECGGATLRRITAAGIRDVLSI